ncbi:hypothetical protein [Novosphingobium mangrovi (ex Huang et al. 2023)]|uniref:Sugar transporter n=1 Tax=Novosphingobium mangrovi (ex Huang et al. 2023) TaxID=2976432 RepID=A0ABT2I261_9SPHN|nr:hypothetical protein [Novosphingobium mangrovi (ex Huang et al. 2023)]MCT2398890.1 hypothetical protein [Novosphingobium mangrovi (ex Huang et al. 2023)]
MVQAGMQAAAKASWWFWIIAVLSLLWNAMGCADFTMTVTREPAYIAQFPPEVIDWLDAAPTVSLVVWAMGVWGALAGSLLLLLRSRWAVTAFAVSLAGLAGTLLWQLASDMPASMTTPANVAFSVAIWIVALALLWYAIRMRGRGVLR